MTIEPGDLVVRFVRSIGRPAEADYYLSLFRAERPESFAIIAVSEGVMRDAADALLVDLRFLAQLGLTPVVVFGVVAPARARVQAESVCAALAPGVPCELVEPEDAASVARAGRIPLVPFAGAAADIGARFDRLAAMAQALSVRKIIFLGRRSGLQPRGTEPLSLLDLTTEYDALVTPGVLSRKQRDLLQQIRRIVDAIPTRLTVSVTSPLDLLRELFTVRGAGTLVRRGSRVIRHPSMAAAGPARLAAVLESAFGRRLRADFFDQPVLAVFVADDFRGAAVVTDSPLGPYLSKFAVDVAAQGEGVGRDLWRALIREFPTLFWRSRSDNAFTGWYQQQCDGMVRAGGWYVFWRGIAKEHIPAAIDWAESATVDFEPNAAD